MNKSALSIAVKYGVILGILSVISGFFVVNSNIGEEVTDGLRMASLFAIGIMWIVKLGILARSHYEFNEVNNDYISFKDAILIGLIVLGITQVFSTAFAFVNFEYLHKEQFESMMNKYPGAEISASSMIFSGMLGGILVDVFVLFVLITFESLWKIFKKAGKDGWAALIPFYNTITMLDIVGKPIVWFILMFIPVVNIILGIWVVNLLAKRFGKSEGYTVGMLLLPFIFYPMLGMSEQQMIPLEEVY